MPALLPPPTTPDDAPAAQNGPRGHRTRPTDRGRAWLDRLFADAGALGAVPCAPLAPGPRTAAEHDAASRAAGCRDLFVVSADPFAGEQLIAELARATAERVLVLTPNPTAADRITDRLLKCGVAALRALAADENPTRPSPAVSRVTSAALGAGRAEQVRREAAAAVAAAEKRVEAFAPVSKAVARLREVRGLLRDLDAAVAEQTARRDRTEAEVRAETDTPFARALAHLRAERVAATARLAAELETVTADHTDRAAELARVQEHLADAARKPGFFGRLFGGKPRPGAPTPLDAEKHAQTLESEVAALAARVAELQKQMDAATAALETEREALVAAEVATRRAGVEAALATAESDLGRARAEAAALNKVIAAVVPHDDPAAAERNLAEVRERAAGSARAAQEALARSLTDPRVVVGIPGCLGSDPVFPALPDDPPFGLLILDRAEELPEHEFPRLARLAARWVLVGDVFPADPRQPLNGAARGRNGRPAEVPFAARVAKLLDRETWAAEGDRLVCRLAHLTPEQRRTVTHEPLADRPEIELRFTAAADDGEPVLAEIAFPGATAVPEAKQFLLRALGEVLLRPCGDAVWTNDGAALAVTWPAADTDRGAVWIDLEPGVREKVTGTGLFTYTAAVCFDTAAGWDAERAAAWLAKHMPPSATGRFAALPRSPGPRPL